MSLKIRSWKKIISRTFWAIFLLAIIGFFGKVAAFEQHYLQEKEGSPRSISQTAEAEIVDETEITPTAIENYSVPATNPRYLSIEKLGIKNARILSVGIKSNGELGTPTSIFDTGWYDVSSKPGQGGTLLIDGHNGGPTKAGIFKHLPTLISGDIITVERGDGKIFNYEVVENIELPLDKSDAYMATALETPVAGKESVTLITCTGEWSAARNTYLARQFVRAVLKSKNS